MRITIMCIRIDKNQQSGTQRAKLGCMVKQILVVLSFAKFEISQIAIKISYEVHQDDTISYDLYTLKLKMAAIFSRSRIHVQYLKFDKIIFESNSHLISAHLYLKKFMYQANLSTDQVCLHCSIVFYSLGTHYPIQLINHLHL